MNPEVWVPVVAIGVGIAAWYFQVLRVDRRQVALNYSDQNENERSQVAPFSFFRCAAPRGTYTRII